MTVPAIASAGTFDDPPLHGIGIHPDVAHFDGGIEWLAGQARTGAASTTAFRGHFVLGHHVGHTAEPYLALGATFAIGQVSVAPMPAPIGEQTALFGDLGPELQAGVTYDRIRVYSNAALIHTSFASGVEASDLQSAWGTRVSIGVDMSLAKWHALGPMFRDDEDPAAAMFGLLAATLPTHLELAWEHGSGGDRIGADLAWGL